MEFLKKFFDDESKIIGLCGFETMKPKYEGESLKNEGFFNHFQSGRSFSPQYTNIFETNFAKNALLL